APAPVIACSALKRSYRDLLRKSAPELVCIHLDAPREVIAGHLAHRDHEFMSPALLHSQLDTLEPLTAEEAHATVAADHPVSGVLRAVLGASARLGSWPSGRFRPRPTTYPCLPRSDL